MIIFGLSPLMVLVIDLVIASAPKEKSGSASSMSETCSEIGMAMGIATLGALGTTVYRHLMACAVPSGVPSEEADAIRDSLPGAATATQNLEPPLAAQVMDVAERALMRGPSAVGHTSVAIVLGVAITVFLFLLDVSEEDRR